MSATESSIFCPLLAPMWNLPSSIEKLHGVELGGVADAGQFLSQLVDLLLNLKAVGSGVAPLAA